MKIVLEERVDRRTNSNTCVYNFTASTRLDVPCMSDPGAEIWGRSKVLLDRLRASQKGRRKRTRVTGPCLRKVAVSLHIVLCAEFRVTPLGQNTRRPAVRYLTGEQNTTGFIKFTATSYQKN